MLHFKQFYIHEFFSGHFRRFPKESYLHYHIPIARNFLSFPVFHPVKIPKKDIPIILDFLKNQIYHHIPDMDLTFDGSLSEFLIDFPCELKEKFSVYIMLQDFIGFRKSHPDLVLTASNFTDPDFVKH